MVGVKSVCRNCNPINWRFTVALLLGITSSLSQADLTISDGETFSLNSAESLTVSGNLTIENNASLLGDTAGDATIRVDGNWSNSGTFTHNNDAVFLTGTGASIVSGSNTFHTLVADHAESDTGPGKAITFAANTTQTIAHTLTLKGSSGNLMALASTSPGSAATLDVTGATVTASYLDITDSILSGYNASKPGDTNSTDNGGNSGWFNTAPTITSTALTSIGADEVYSYTVTANDADGDAVTLSATTIPSWLTFTPSTGVLTGTAGSSNLGTHNTVITASDNFGGSVTDSFVITVSDVTAPVITLTGDAVVSLEQATTYNDDGATASDNIDGDITGNIVTVNPVDVDTVGSYTVTYNVSDAAGNVATQVTRTVNITADVTAPVITLVGSATVSVASGDTYTDDGATATDNVDGDITGSIVTVNSVDTSTVGTYSVTYNVTDATGNVATEVTRTVNVLATADTTLPEIMLVGDASVSVEQGTVYTDAGATASDNVDGDITASIVTVNPVDTTLVGTYTVTYNVSDSSGNTATEVTRTVTVTPDATAPVIALVGDASVSIEQGTAYNELGASATDAVDDNTSLSSNIVIDSSAVDITTVGTYTVTYNVSDSAGNVATEVTRTVNVTADATPPVITLEGAANVSVELGSAYVELGATATDAVDDDTTLSNNIIIDASAVDVNTAGTYSVTYNLSDAAGNAATEVVRTVNVATDIILPVIHLVGDAVVSVELGSDYTDAGATASDNLDGDITASIVTVNPVDVNTVGTYTITYNVTDSSGNAALEVTRTVTVSESGLSLTTDVFALVEGETDNFGVKLKVAPLSTVVINLTSSDEAEVMLSTATLNFNDENWDTEQTVTISAVDDYNLDDSSAVITLAVDKPNSDSSFHNVADKTISISIENSDTALGLIEQFNNGDGTTPPPPSLSLYQQEIGITGITQENLLLVNAAVLAADTGGADTVAEIQAIVDAVENQPVFETALNVATVNFDESDEVIASLLDQHALGFAGIVAMIDQGNQAMGYQSVLDRNPNDTVVVTAGRSELGDKDGLLQIDNSPDLELFIDIDGDTMPDLMWSPAENRVERVSFHLTGMVGHTSQDISDQLGYPMHTSTLAGVSSQPQLSGSADDANHPFKLWAYSEDQLIAVTETLYTATTADENGQYAWQVSTEDYIQPLAIGDNMLIVKGSVSLPLPVTVSAPSLSLSMQANRKQASAGSLVTYTVQVENKSAYALSDVTIKNDLPQGFIFVENSARWDHDADAQTPMVQVSTSSHHGGKTRHFDLGNVSASSVSQILRYQVRVGSGVNKGTYTNSASASDNAGTPNNLSDDISLPNSQASAEIRVVEDALFEMSTVIGKVFNDINGNGWQDPGDLPVPHVRLVTSAGQQVTTDANGQYHLGAMRPGRMVVRIDERSLPEQTQLLGHRSQVVDIRPGIPSKVNFAVQLAGALDNKQPVRIEALSKQLKPRLTIGAFGAAQLNDQQLGFIEPLEIRAYSNYAAFITQWQVQITEDFSRRVVKTFSGVGPDLFAPIYWDGSSDQGDFVDPERDYTLELTVSDALGHKAFTHRQGLQLSVPSPALAQKAPANKQTKRVQNLAYKNWLQRLAKQDTTARSHIRVIGKSIRVSGEYFGAVRISLDNQLLVEMPSYQQPESDVADILRGQSLNKDLSQKTHIDLIVPRGKLHIQVLGDKAIVSEQSASQPLIQPPIQPVAQTTAQQSVISQKTDATSAGQWALEQLGYLAGSVVEFVFPKAHADDVFDIPSIDKDYLSQQKDYQYTLQLLSGTDRQKLVQTIERYKDSLDISRAALLSANSPQGVSYSLIYGLYSNYKTAKETLDSVIPRAFKERGAWVRVLNATQSEQSMPQHKAKVSIASNKVIPLAQLELDAAGNKLPAVTLQYLLDQGEYSHTIELLSGNDPQQLVKVAQQYRKTQNISRFALLIVAKGDGNYALIYGIYHNYQKAKRTLQRELPRALADLGAQVRSLVSMQPTAVAGIDAGTQSASAGQTQLIFEQTIDTQQLTASDDYFLVGIVDAQLAHRDITGNIDLAKSGDSRYKDKIWKDGKIQLYFKGTVAGDYLVTASIDSERDVDDLFSNLDPDATYALYGDNSAVNDLVAEADGPLYLLVERDLSWAKWGRLQVALDNSELASFQRALQGGQVHYESTQSTAYGEAVTEADAFAARVRQKSAYVEYLSTGSSLYYLKHQGALRDSLNLRLEVRDAVSGNVKSSRHLTLNDDYQFDAASGRITFWMPPEREIQSELIIGSERGAVDRVYVVADYSYSIADDWSEGVSGGQIEQAFGDHIRLGVTQVEEQQQGGNYTLEGINSTLRLGENHTLELEYARSESRAEPKYFSTDGGLTWGINESAITAADGNQTGDAVSLRGRIATNEDRTQVNYYARDISEDFSSSGYQHQRGQKAAGVDLSHRLNQDLSVRLKHDWQERVGAGEIQSNYRTGATESSSSTLQVNYDVSDKLTLSSEVRYQTATDADPLNLTDANRDGETYAVQGRYRFDENTELSLTQQAHLSGDADSQTRIGLRKRINDKLSLQARLSEDGSGTAYSIASIYNLDDKLSINTALEQDSSGRTHTAFGTGYSPNPDTYYNLGIQERRDAETKTSQSVIVGANRKLGEQTTLGAGTSFALSGENKRNGSDINLSHTLNDGRELRGAISRYSQLEGDDGYSEGHEINMGADIDSHWSAFITLGQGDIHRIDGGLDKRTNMALGSAYLLRDEQYQELLTGRLRIEQREDRGQQNTDTYLVDLDIKGRLNDDLTLISSLDLGESKDIDNDTLSARNNRFDLGFAYRPVLSDRFNLVSKYSWVDYKQPDNQLGDIGFERHKGHVLAADILYDFSPQWRLGTKLAARYGDEKMPELPWAKTERWLGATRLGYRFNPDTTLFVEYRMLKDLQADDQQEGSAIELVRRFENIEVGIGFNHAGFSDDLGIMDYTEQRGYLRITGVLE